MANVSVELATSRPAEASQGEEVLHDVRQRGRILDGGCAVTRYNNCGFQPHAVYPFNELNFLLILSAGGCQYRISLRSRGGGLIDASHGSLLEDATWEIERRRLFTAEEFVDINNQAGLLSAVAMDDDGGDVAISCQFIDPRREDDGVGGGDGGGGGGGGGRAGGGGGGGGTDLEEEEDSAGDDLEDSPGVGGSSGRSGGGDDQRDQDEGGGGGDNNKGGGDKNGGGDAGGEPPLQKRLKLSHAAGGDQQDRGGGGNNGGGGEGAADDAGFAASMSAASAELASCTSVLEEPDVTERAWTHLQMAKAAINAAESGFWRDAFEKAWKMPDT